MLKTAVLLHLSDAVYLHDFKATLEHLPAHFDLFINQVEGLSSREILNEQTEALAEAFPNAQFTRTENRGMEVGGMMRLFSRIQGRSYQAILFAHSKSNKDWRKKMLHMFSEQAGKILLQLGTTRYSPNSEVGMIGGYIHPYDYYSITPFLQLADQLELDINTSWNGFIRQHPDSAKMPVTERARWASENQILAGRPEVDVEYARAVFGKLGTKTEHMSEEFVTRFVNDSVYGPLPYFPGNFFWLNGKVLDLLAQKINFKDEYQRLPAGDLPDRKVQSHVYAWERILPVFAVKNGFRALALN